LLLINGGQQTIILQSALILNLLDFETKRDHSITVKAVDASGEMVEKSLLITVKGKVKSNPAVSTKTYTGLEKWRH
jgi:hypothetical protein